MKKILSLILALVMTLSLATFIFADDDAAITTAAPAEVDETASAYYDAVKLLVSYGIMHGKGDGVLGVYDNIKRYEMALFIGRILTGWVDDLAWEDGTLNSSEFTDLEGTAAESYYGAISFVNQAGVIEGYGDGRFGPENGITYQDALTMAVRALGYQGLAYPWGYIQKAVNLGLTTGISGVAFTDELKREVVAQIIYNAIFAQPAEGDTLGAQNFGINGAWQNVIIIDTSFMNEELPAGYVGFSIVAADGTLYPEVYYAPEASFGISGEHGAEKQYGALFKVILDGSNVIVSVPLEMEPVLNRGRLEVTTKGYPIQAFLADYTIVTRYGTTYMPNEIILTAGTGLFVDYDYSYESCYAVDWYTGNIIYIQTHDVYVEPTYHQMWITEGGGAPELKPCDIILDDESDPDSDIMVGIYATVPNAPGSTPELAVPVETLAPGYWWLMGSLEISGSKPWIQYSDGNKWYDPDPYYADPANGSRGYAPWNVYQEGYWTKGIVDMQVVWYYNELLDEYFMFEESFAGADPVGIRWMTEAEREDLVNLVNGDIYYDAGSFNFLTKDNIETDASNLNAYATLRIFDNDEDGLAEYGIYEEYRFAIYEPCITVQEYDREGKPVMGPGHLFRDVSLSPFNNLEGFYEYAAEFADWGAPKGEGRNLIKQQLQSLAKNHSYEVPEKGYWFSDGVTPETGAYVIYGINYATGEIKIIKTITEVPQDDDETYVGHGYVRAFNADNMTITIGEDKVSYNYPQLKGSITEAMTFGHVPVTSRLDYAAWAATASRFVKTLFNEYVEYVVIDGRLVYLTVCGNDDGINLFVINKYQSASSKNGTHTVLGWNIGNNIANRNNEMTTLNIRAINGLTYSELTSAQVKALKQHGNVLKLGSYDPEADAYNVEILGLDGLDVLATGERWNYNTAFTALTYQDCTVNIMQINAPGRAPGGAANTEHDPTLRIMSDNDKYTFIIGGEGADFTVPIMTWEGKVNDASWFVYGHELPGSQPGNWIIYVEDLADINGFYGRYKDVGLVLFLEYGEGFEINGSAVTYKARVFDIIDSHIKTIEISTRALTPAYLGEEADIELGTVMVGMGDNWWQSGGTGTQDGPYADGYNQIFHEHFAYITGDVFLTYGGKIYDYTPIQPARVPYLMNAIVGEGNFFIDGIFKEVGVVSVRNDGSYQGTSGNNKMWNSGQFGTYYEGFRPIDVNTRITNKMIEYCGISASYARLAQIGLPAYESRSTVFVWALKEVNGRVQLAHVAADDGGGKSLAVNAQTTNAGLVCANKLRAYFDDGDKSTQHYYYTMYFTEDSSNVGSTKNDKSYCNIYVYDFEDDPALNETIDYSEYSNVWGWGLEDVTAFEDSVLLSR